MKRLCTCSPYDSLISKALRVCASSPAEGLKFRYDATIKAVFRINDGNTAPQEHKRGINHSRARSNHISSKER